MPREIKTIRNGRWLYRLEFQDGRFTGNVEREPIDPEALEDAAIEINGMAYHPKTDFSGLATPDFPLTPAAGGLDREKKVPPQRNMFLAVGSLFFALAATFTCWSFLNYDKAFQGIAMADVPMTLYQTSVGKEQLRAAIPRQTAEVPPAPAPIPDQSGVTFAYVSSGESQSQSVYSPPAPVPAPSDIQQAPHGSSKAAKSDKPQGQAKGVRKDG